MNDKPIEAQQVPSSASTSCENDIPALAASQCPRCGGKQRPAVIRQEALYAFKLCDDPWHDTPADSAPAADRLAAKPSHEGFGPAAGGGATPIGRRYWRESPYGAHWDYDDRVKNGFAPIKSEPIYSQAQYESMKRQRDEAIRETQATKNIIDSLLIRAKVAEGEKFDSIVIASKENFDSAMREAESIKNRLEAAEREAEALRRGEYICSKCGLRKDAETKEADF